MFINISEAIKNCKEFLKENEKDIFLAVLIVLVGFLSFGLGRLSRIFENKMPIEIQNAVETKGAPFDEFSSDFTSGTNASASVLGTAAQDEEQVKNFVASKNGTKYYFPWCGGVEKIKEENKIWFASKEEAAKKGYEPAKNCKGL